MTTPDQEAIALKIERELLHSLDEHEAWALRCGIQEAAAHGRDQLLRTVETATRPAPQRHDETPCHAWREAVSGGGLDSEGYGNPITERRGEWTIGSGNPAARFCPWCGQPVKVATETNVKVP